MFHVASVLHFHLRYQRGMVAMQSIATTTDDLENREINAAEVHSIHPKWAYGGGAGPRAEAAFRWRPQKNHPGFAGRETGRSRRSQVPKELREGRDEA
jgi:hypothetical protein